MMFNFMKRMFTHGDDKPLIEKKYKMRVRRFSDTSDNYCIEYSYGYTTDWKYVTYTWDRSDDIELLDRHQPILDRDFDSLVHRGETLFNTIEKLTAHINAENEIYSDAVIRITKVNASKNKYKELEL